MHPQKNPEIMVYIAIDKEDQYENRKKWKW